MLRFPHACFSSVLIVIGLVSMSPDGHIGTKLLAAYQLVGQAWLGAITAGLMVGVPVVSRRRRGLCIIGVFSSWCVCRLCAAQRLFPALFTDTAFVNMCVYTQVTIAKPVELVSREAYIAALCVTTCLGLGLLTSSRAGPAPITLW